MASQMWYIAFNVSLPAEICCRMKQIRPSWSHFNNLWPGAMHRFFADATCASPHILIDLHIYTYTCAYMYVICVDTYVCIYIYIYIYTCTCVYTYTSVSSISFFPCALWTWISRRRWWYASEGVYSLRLTIPWRPLSRCWLPWCVPVVCCWHFSLSSVDMWWNSLEAYPKARFIRILPNLRSPVCHSVTNLFFIGMYVCALGRFFYSRSCLHPFSLNEIIPVYNHVKV